MRLGQFVEDILLFQNLFHYFSFISLDKFFNELWCSTYNLNLNFFRGIIIQIYVIWFLRIDFTREKIWFYIQKPLNLTRPRLGHRITQEVWFLDSDFNIKIWFLTLFEPASNKETGRWWYGDIVKTHFIAL